ncbi:MAG: RNA polymerase sigma factor RpoD/SigA [Tenericutes bacterium]|nr:RNA polymerase sigma factor RpoD/SigA [Mycoplasmatota bacterium]
MNSEFVLKLVRPYLRNNSIHEDDFEKLFEFLTLHEKYGVIDILIKNNIDIRYEETEDNSNHNDERPDGKSEDGVTGKKLSSNIKISNEQLCIMYQNGDKTAIDLLYIKNQRFIWKIVNKYSRIFNQKLDDEDLVSYGFFGLEKAAKKFDPSLEYKFTTYAGYWIMQSVSRAIADYGFTVRIPVHMFELVKYISTVSKDFESQDELIEYIVEKKNEPYEKVKNALTISHNIINPSSLNASVGEDQGSELGDFIPSLNPSIETEIEEVFLKAELLEVMGSLKEKESNILQLRYGFDGHAMTLEEVGQIYSVTRERIRQIEAKALARLRKMKKVKELHLYLEE